MVYHKAITPSRGESAFQAFLDIRIHLSHRRVLFPHAWELAQALNQPRAYDATYLALAQTQDCDFWTADEKLYNAVKDRLPWVHWIGNYSVNGKS